jgi:hypothetical protein
MRPAVLLCTVLLATAAGLAISCGGSSSETPWPTEPDPAAVVAPPELKPLPSTTDEDAGARHQKE